MSMGFDLQRHVTKSALVAISMAALVGCDEPSRDRVERELGGEAPGVPAGPLHRAGQPCVLCHDGDAARALSLGGTVYWQEGSSVPAIGASVHLVDSLETAWEQRVQLLQGTMR